MNRLFFFAAVIILSVQTFLFSQFAGGSGTEADPWLIRTPENLDSLRYYLGADHNDKYFKQIADIDLGVAPWNVGEGWEPIGRDSTFFMGDYDGDGFKIENLYINRLEEDYIGLFGSAKNSNLSRICIKNANITGSRFTGTLAGWYINSLDYDFGLITECSSSGFVSGMWGTGGLIGSFYAHWDDWHFSFNPNASNSFSRCSVTSREPTTSSVGGFLGDGGPFHGISNSYSTGQVVGGYGFSGGSWYDWSNSNYWDIESSGCLTSYSAEGRTTEEMTENRMNTYENWDFENIWTEDIYGINDGYPVLISHLNKEIPSVPQVTDVVINGLEFNITWINPATQRNGDSLSELTAVHITRNGVPIHTVISPVIGGNENFTDILTESGYYTYRIYGENSAGLGLFCKTSHIIGQMFSGGTGTETDPYLISDPEDLNNIRQITGFKENKKYFSQTADIDMNIAPWNAEPYWQPIEYFTDNYNGGDFKISNLIVYDTEKSKVGLFRDTDGASISDLVFENAGIVGSYTIGCVAGSAVSSLIKNVSATVKNSGNSMVGGLAGYAVYTFFENCTVTGEITSSNTSGGLVASLEFGLAKDCIADIEFLGSVSYTGGLIGKIIRSSITGSSAECAMTGYSYLGGLVGIADAYFGSGSSEITKCHSKGSIEGAYYLGGFMGQANESFNIEDCYSFTNVKGSGGYYIGGFCGDSYGFGAEIINCYSKGFVDASGPLNSVGGFLGSVSNTAVSLSYWDTETSGQTESEGGYGFLTEIMTDPDFWYHSGWDFENIWKIDPLLNGGYPYLKWQSLTGIEDNPSSIPKEFTLDQNYPNPFNPVTQIKFALAKTANIKLSVYNIAGQKVTELLNGVEKAGYHTAAFDGSKFNSGIYYYTLEANGKAVTKKMLMVK